MCAFWCPRWRCVFAVWLRLPGEPAGAECAGGRCPLSPFCRRRGSLVPGAPVSSWSVFPFPAEVASRRAVARAWLLRAGWPGPGSGWVLSSAFALPFPSVLSAAARAGVLPSLWRACRRSRALFSAWLGAGCPRFGG